MNRANTVRVALAMFAVGLMAGLSCRKPSGTGAPPSLGGSSSSSARVVVNTTEDGLLEVAAQNGALDAEALAQVTDWSKVVQLRIQECGELDEGLWQRIGTAENLKKLELIRVPVTDDDLQTLAACRSLEELLLAHTAVQGNGLRHLSGLQLQKLVFHSRQATQEGLRAIEALKELRELELGCPELRLAGLPHLAQLPHLEKLTAHATPLGLDGIEILSGHSQLKVVWLNARGMEDKHLSVLNSLTQLEDLTLAGASITDDGLGQLKLPRLRRLFLDACTEVTDAGLYHLSGMPELEELLLMGSGVRGEDLMGLAESGLKKLRRVFLNADQVRGGQPVIDALHGKLPDCEVIILRG